MDSTTLTLSQSYTNEKKKETIDYVNQQVFKSGNLTTDQIENVDKIPDLSSQLEDIATKIGIRNTLNKFTSGQTAKVVCCGDSLTFGAEQIPSTNQVANPYPKLLQENLRKIYNNNNITVINKGKCGASSYTWTYDSQGIEAIEYSVNVLGESPDMVILMLGYNDIGSGLTIQQYTENILKMIRLTHARGIDLVLMSPPYSTRKEYGGIWNVNEKLKQLSDVVENIAISHNIFFIDIHNEMLDIFYKHNSMLPNEIIGMDFIHYIDYSILTNIIIKNLQGNISLNVIGETIQPIVGNLYVETNTPNDGYVFSTSSDFKLVYGGQNGKGSSLYYKIRLNVLKKNMSLKLFFGGAVAHGNIVIKDNGTDVKTVNMNISDTSYTSILFGSKVTVVDNLSLGYHEILISSDNFIETGKYMVLEGFSVEENRNITLCENIEVNAISGVGLSKAISNYTIERKDGKKTIIKVVGVFPNGTGIKPIMLNGFNTPVIVNFNADKLYFSETDLNVVVKNTVMGINTYDLKKKHEFKFVFDGQNVKSYIDGILETDVTLTYTNMLSGKLGVWSNGAVNGIIQIDKASVYYTN